MEKKWVIVFMLSLSLSGVAIGVISYIKGHKFASPDIDRIWYVKIDPSSGTEMLVRGGKIDVIKHDEKKLVEALNGTDRDPEKFRSPINQEPNDPPKVKLLAIKNHEVSVEIVNAEFLTEKMGSSGAQAYLASVTFTLTEAPEIKKVKFIFPKGDHAMPGIYTRKDFKNYKIIRQGDRSR